jgi:hypothetical protein
VAARRDALVTVIVGSVTIGLTEDYSTIRRFDLVNIS